MTYEDLYAECIANGCSPQCAEMLASHAAPWVETDATFMSGSSRDLNCESATDKLLVKRSEKMGVSTQGKKYISQLAEFPGDPKAWVDGRGDIKRACEKNGFNCEGAVKVNSFEQPKLKPKAKKTSYGAKLAKAMGVG